MALPQQDFSQFSVHFIGIGGTAMAGAAVMARELGFRVTGSDQNLYSPTLDELLRVKISFRESYAAENLPADSALIVLGNAISRGNVELEEALNRRLNILSLPQFVAEYIIRRRDSLVIAGTHGKTTSTSLAAHALRTSGIDAGYMVGGVCESLPTTAAVGSADKFVLEGDEYDTSIFDPRPKFLSYRPTHVLINNIEFDHADIFADFAAVETAFMRLIKIIPQNGVLVTNADNESCMKLASAARTHVVTFGRTDRADFQLEDFSVGERMVVHVRHAGQKVEIETPLLGEHNALNIAAVTALLTNAGLGTEQIRRAMASFQGVRRRLQKRFASDKLVVIEDFAHHPTAIETNLRTLKQLYAARRIVVLIEPRSNTMVRKFFQARLVDALMPADVIIVDRIYRAEKYAESDRLDLQKLKADLERAGKSVHLMTGEDRVDLVLREIRDGDVVCFMTNGSFGGLIDQTVNALAARTR